MLFFLQTHPEKRPQTNTCLPKRQPNKLGITAINDKRNKNIGKLANKQNEAFCIGIAQLYRNTKVRKQQARKRQREHYITLELCNCGLQ